MMETELRGGMSKSISVLMVTGEYPPGLGGVGDYTSRLSTQLAESGVRVTVLTSGTEAIGAPDREFRQVQVLRAVPEWTFGSWFRVGSVATRFQAQVVHLQYQSAAYALHPAVNLLPGFLRARLSDVRVVTTFHDLRVPYIFPKAGPLRRWAVRALDRLSNASIVTNQADLDDLDGTGSPPSPPRRWLIPLGSNVDNAPPPDMNGAISRRLLGVEEGTLLISYFGLMNASKGVEILVEALQLLASRGLDAKLLIVGGETGESDPTNRSYSRRVLQQVRSLHLEDRVIWTGYLEPDRVSAALLASDLCALPFRDGASLRRGSLMAALVHGLPVVTTRPLRSEPLLVNGENVATVERGNPEALAGELEKLWRNPPIRRHLGEGAISLAAHFRWEDIAANHRTLYEALLS